MLNVARFHFAPDIPMVPAMSRCGNSKELSFVAHWLNNKELQFSNVAEKILEELSRKSSAMEESVDVATDTCSDSDDVSSSDNVTESRQGKGRVRVNMVESSPRNGIWSKQTH